MPRVTLFGGPEDGRKVDVPYPPPTQVDVLLSPPHPTLLQRDPAPEPVADAPRTGRYTRRRTRGGWVYAWEGLR